MAVRTGRDQGGMTPGDRTASFGPQAESRKTEIRAFFCGISFSNRPTMIEIEKL
jgi:hypothetical protein